MRCCDCEYRKSCAYQSPHSITSFEDCDIRNYRRDLKTSQQIIDGLRFQNTSLEHQLENIKYKMATYDNYINKQELILSLSQISPKTIENYEQVIINFPTVADDYYGFWIPTNDYFTCSNCKKSSPIDYDFCPNCGIKIKKEGKNDYRINDC